MFSSGKHADLRDARDAKVTGRDCICLPNRSGWVRRHKAGCRWHNPRRRHLTNPANPILVAFRSIEGTLTGYAAAAGYWLSALDSFDAFGGFVAWEHSGAKSILDATDEQREHARAVLTGLGAAGVTS